MNIVINLNKDNGITSHEAVTRVKRLFKIKKAGHAGTLDPLATGVLLVCLNEATKITGYLSDLDKEYLAVIKLGETTDTYDSEGRIVRKVSDFEVSVSEINKAIQMFIGDIEQTPPMYSAIKLNGKPLYKFARQGVEVEIKPRKVSIYSIEFLNYEPPLLTIKVACSKGTYIRSLCNDIGNVLGIGAHLTELKRTKIGHFIIENSAKLEELPDKNKAIDTINHALRHIPDIRLFDTNLQKVRNGNSVREDDLKSSMTGSNPTISTKSIRLKDHEGRIFGIGRIVNGWLKPERLFNFYAD